MRSQIEALAADSDLSEHQCLVLCVMSHGKQQTAPGDHGDVLSSEYIYGSDGCLVSTNSLLAPLTNDNCRLLARKPKIVIFQACRGGWCYLHVLIVADCRQWIGRD